MQNLKAKLKAQGGFTLIEMLLVVAIIVILVAISIPMVNTNLENARDAVDQANERAAKTLALLYYQGVATDPIKGWPYDDGTYSPGTSMTFDDTKAWDDYGNEFGVFYDAKNGVLTCERPKGYGQCTGHTQDRYAKYNPLGGIHTNYVILVKLDQYGKFEAKWVPDVEDRF